MERSAVLTEEAAGQRLDRALALAWPDLSRTRIQALVRDGHLRVDGVVWRDLSGPAPVGAAVELVEPPPRPATPQAEAIALDIVHEDDALIVVNKPAGLVVHPAPGHAGGTLVNALLAHCGETLSGIGGVARPGIVHRLDRDTSGLLVVAKTDRAHAALSAQFADHGRTGVLERAYLAFVWGVPEPSTGTVTAALGRSPRDREKIAVLPPGRGRDAITHYATREVYRGDGGEALASLVRCRLETGRTHQIRVHLAHLRHPLLGDDVYGAGFRTKAGRLGEGAQASVAALGRQALHATLLQFAHPADGRVMRFESALPADLQGLQKALGGGAAGEPGRNGPKRAAVR